MTRLLLIPAALVLLVGLSLVWSGAALHREAPADFIFINRGDVGTLDPNSMSWLQDIRLGYAIWEGLYSLDPQTLDPVLGCAQSVTTSDDKTIHTFQIRPEARWHNGEPVTAGDFAFAWRRMLEQPGDYTYLLYYIKGAKEYSDAFTSGTDPKPDFGAVGIAASADDPKRLTVTLKHPVVFFPDLCAFPPFFPLHKGSMEPFRDKQTGRYDGGFTRPPHLVGNGPYRLDKWEFRKRLRLVASESYWDRANVRSPIIDMLSFGDPRTAFLKYETGKVDWLAEVGNDDAADLLAVGRKDLRVFTGFGTYFYSLNCLPKLPDGSANPCADVRVRKALSMAVDRTPIVKNITRLGQPEAFNYIPPGIFKDYQSPRGLGFDVEQARRLLSDAGYPGGRGLPRISILFNSEGDHKIIAQNIARQWEQNLGVKFDLQGVEIKVFRGMLHDKNYAIARASWIGDYNDVSTFTDKYLSDSDNNDSGWVSEQYDRLCHAAAVETDPARRLVMLQQAEQILCNEAPIIPLYYYVNAYLFPDNVKGVPLNPRNMVVFKAVKR